MAEVRPDSEETCRLLEQVGHGEATALDRLFDRYRSDLSAFVDARLDGRVRGRADASDVVQEALMEVSRRMDDFLKRRPMPFRLWLRKTAYERLLDLHRAHRRDRRSVGREVALPNRSSLLMARPLLAVGASPSQELEAAELADHVAKAVAQLSDGDREVLLLRHGEGLPFVEIACILGVDSAVARKRFGRALLRLQDALADQGLLE